MKKVAFIILLLFTSLIPLFSQDVHFTQYHAMPMNLNPAMTGFFNGDIRIGAIYRNQWFTLKTPFANTTYQTFGGFLDASILRDKLKGSFLGLGVSAFHDIAGDLGMGTTDATFNLAYSQRIGRRVKHSIALGLQGQLTSKGFSKTGNAILPTSNNESLGRTVTNFDAGVGLRYHVDIKKRLNLYVAGAYFHILQPNEAFNEAGGMKIYSKINVSAGALVEFTPHFNLLPSFFFSKQGPSYQVNAGTYFQYVFGEATLSRNAISFGFSTRFAKPLPDALALLLRADYGGLQANFSYDFNISDLSKASIGQGAAEISLIYLVNFTKKKRLDNTNCARF